MAALVNSRWYAAHPFAVQAPSYSSDIPTSIIDEVTDPVITQIEVLDSDLYISLDGSPTSASEYDFKLPAMTAGAERCVLLVDPSLVRVFSTGGAARYAVAFEAGLLSRYPIFKPVSKVFSAAPLTSSGIPTGLTSGSDDTFQTVLQVMGTDPLYVTLDGRIASASSYDRKLAQNDNQSPGLAYYFDVDPSLIRVIGGADTQYKVGFNQFTSGESGSWTDNPLYQIRGFR